MGVLDDIKQRVEDIATERSMSADDAFAFWFLEEVEELSQEEAEETAIGGPYDKGRDAVYHDLEAGTLKIYQMKYSESREYVLSAFRDLQRGLQAEYENDPEKFKSLNAIELKVVTTHTADNEFHSTQANQQKRIRTWLTNNGFRELSGNSQVEVFDLKKFAQLMERLYGVDLELEFREPPLEEGGTILGLINATEFSNHINREELLAFNIRKFLGIRKGSVNSKIKDTLEDESRRDKFWIYNNGIVCLCTGVQLNDDPRRRVLKDFTIVNGAQTVSTISKFLAENPMLDNPDTPIWVVAKIVQVAENDLDLAVVLTQTSNTQTPASGRDLRAVDIGHTRLTEWLRDLGHEYIFKRGSRAPKGVPSVQMKDLAQGYIAFWCGRPHVSFARAGSIFAKNELYDLVFPADEINTLSESGSKEAQLDFARARLLPALLLNKLRSSIKESVRGGIDKKWTSMTYHLLHVYGLLLADHVDKLELVVERLDTILDETSAELFGALLDIADHRAMEVPRVFKTEAFMNAIAETDWTTKRHASAARAKIANALESLQDEQ